MHHRLLPYVATSEWDIIVGPHGTTVLFLLWTSAEFGNASFMWLAPAFRHGPRENGTDLHAQRASKPIYCKFRLRVAGCFLLRHIDTVTCRIPTCPGLAIHLSPRSAGRTIQSAAPAQEADHGATARGIPENDFSGDSRPMVDVSPAAPPHPLPVRQACALHSASYKFAVARGILAAQLTLPLAGRAEDFHLLVSAPCRAHNEKRPSLARLGLPVPLRNV